MSISLSRAVSMMTGTDGARRSARHTSVPDSPGSMRSSSTMSAPLRSNSASASGPVRGDRDLEALLAQQVGQRVGDGLLVLDDQHAGHAALLRNGCGQACARGGGSRRVNVEPEPSTLQTLTSPPWLVATCLTMARPSPVPPVARERAGSAR